LRSAVHIATPRPDAAFDCCFPAGWASRPTTRPRCPDR
jgi:hypothetical protein